MFILGLFYSILFASCFKYSLGQDEGSPHFQIDHKSGKLDIMATRTSADIQSNEDYVDLVMKPGEGLGSEYTHDVHHEDESNHQRHDLPEGKQGSLKGEAKDEKEADARKKEAPDKLNNFDGKWMNLFKFPKVNGTVNSKIHRNETSKSETEEQIKERENGKMIELQNDADNLAKLIAESSKNVVNPIKIKDAAANLEKKVEELHSDVVNNFVNNAEAIEKSKGEGKISKNISEAGGDKKVDNNDDKGRNDKVDNANLEGDGKKEKFAAETKKAKGKFCANCGSKIPKAGEVINKPIVPKLSKSDKENKTESKLNKNANFTDAKLENEKKDNATQEWIADANHAVNFGYNGSVVEGEERATKGGKDDSEKNPKAAQDKTKNNKEEKNKKVCSDCGTKVPKPGDKDDGKVIVPKLTGTNETKIENSFAKEEGTKSGGGEIKTKEGKKGKKVCSDCGTKVPKPGDKDDGELVVPKLTGTNESETEKGFKEEEGAKNGDGKIKTNEGKKGKKVCSDCGTKVPKPGDKDDGKLIVPKLTKDNETEKTFGGNSLKEKTIKVENVDKNESFDLDDDAQEITEDANYTELSNAKNEREHGESSGREEIETKNDAKMYANSFEKDKDVKENETATMKIVHVDNNLASKDESNETSSFHDERKMLENDAFGASKEESEKDKNLSSENVSFSGSESANSDVHQTKNTEKENGSDKSPKQGIDSSEAKNVKEIEPKNEEDKTNENEEMKNETAESKEGMVNDKDESISAKEKSDQSNKTESGENNTENINKIVTVSNNRRSKQNITSQIMMMNSSSPNFPNKVETIKQFDKILSSFLNNSSPETGKELLKLTWHDLRQRYAKDKKDNQGKEELTKGRNDEKTGMNKSGPKAESLGTPSKQKAKSAQQLTNNENFKATVKRIKEKISLLKELVEYTKMKKRQKLRKFDPYEGFKREGISS